MKKFRFNLETLLDMRKKTEDRVKLQLAEKNREIINLQQELSSILDQLKDFQKKEVQNRIDKNIDPVLLRYSVTYRFRLKKEMLELGRRIDDLKADAWKINRKLIDAIKERRAIEILKEKRFLEWKKEYSLKEQEYIDDISQQGFIRKMHRPKDASF
ncbi:MAG TPA: flagellar export protein FliJ [Chitinispirillaceae bacterium]|jgi:flagellar FliJ protein|nr:flagellar export protein FliJ [Chitinispirillaceae bacterium]